jgi:NDP-sugar pyrophosphorylase family protein
MYGLDAERSSSLLPLGDRPILQHIVEYFISQGITSIELILGHTPERIEAYLGNGDRWGCSFRYHLAAQPEFPYRSLQVISRARSESWMMVSGEFLPSFDIPKCLPSEIVLYHRASSDLSPNEDPIAGWGGTAIFPAAVQAEDFANLSTEQLGSHLEQLAAVGQAKVIETDEWIDVSTPSALLETQMKMLRRDLHLSMISGTEREHGIWISRNVVLHPSVEMTAPLYIGPNCRINRGVKLGPNTVISSDCLIDTNTTIEDSLIVGGSYIGEGLELSQAIVDRSLLVNARLGTSIDILDSFLLGSLQQPSRPNWFGRGAQSIFAVFLILLFLPVSVLSILYFLVFRRLSFTSVNVVQLPVAEGSMNSNGFVLPCLGADAWSRRWSSPWNAFLRQFLPGLWAVAAGRLSLVGLPPRTLGEIRNLSPDWRSIYLEGRSGLITEANVASANAEDETQLYVADAYYVVRRSWHYDLRLMVRYCVRLAIPGR